MENLLSWLIFIPFIAALVVGFIPKDKSQLIKVIALAATGIQLVLGLLLFFQFDGIVCR